MKQSMITKHANIMCFTWLSAASVFVCRISLLGVAFRAFSTMDEESVKSLMQELTSTAYDQDAGQMGALVRACTIIEDMLAEKYRDVVRRARDRPCLQIFMSDGWSCDIRQRFASSGEQHRVERTGRLRTEFIIQRTIVKAILDSEVCMGMKIERPRPLSFKKCADIVSACCDHIAPLKSLGHQNISICLYLQDGLMAVPFGKRMVARHNLYFKPDLCPLPCSHDERFFLELKDWVLSYRCLAHICSSALKWGLKSLVPDGSLLEDIHITISALLRASSGLLGMVKTFLVSCVVYDRPEPDDVAGLEYMWTLLGVAPTHIDLFLKVNPSWENGVLHVSSSLLNSDDGTSCVSTLIMYTLKFTDFSETRWTKVGEAGRSYLLALMCGVDGLAGLTAQSDAICKWHLAGYKKRSSKASRLYLSVAAAAARPTENLLLDLMSDDRFLQRIDNSWDIVNDEHRYLLATPPLFFERVAAVLGIDPLEYRCHVLECSLTSISYLQMDIWIPFSEAPWKYFQGDCRRHVAALMKEEGVTHPVAVKMQTLIRLGYEEDVIAAAELVKESSLTSTLVEQFHGSGAQLMRRHPQIEHATLCIRMTVHHCRTLFYSNIFDVQEQRLNRQLEAIQKEMQNQKFSGARQAYCKVLIAQIRNGRIVGDADGSSLRRLVFKHHSKGFKGLSGQQVSALNRYASADKSKKLQTLSETKQHVYDQLESLRVRRKDAEAHGRPNHMDSMRFGADDFIRFAQLWAQYRECDLRPDLKAPPEQMTRAQHQLINEELARLEMPKAPRPDWLSQIVSGRDFYSRAGLFSETADAGAGVVYKLLLAIGQPQRAMFLQCKRIAGTEMRWDPRHYRYDDMKIVDHHHVPFTCLGDIMIFPEMRCMDSTLYATGLPVSLVYFGRFHQVSVPASSVSRSSSGRRGGLIDMDMLEKLQNEFPWLSSEELIQILKGHTASTTSASGSAGTTHQTHTGSTTSASGSAGTSTLTEIPEDILEAAANELISMRESFEGHLEEEGSWFTVNVLGGVWSMHRSRQSASDIQAACKDRSTETWCYATGWPPRKSFAVRKHQGVLNARRLSEEMVRRGNHFMRGWIERGSPAPFSFAQLKAAYSAPSSYNDWRNSLIITSEAYTAAQAIEDLVPADLPDP